MHSHDSQYAGGFPRGRSPCRWRPARGAQPRSGSWDDLLVDGEVADAADRLVWPAHAAPAEPREVVAGTDRTPGRAARPWRPCHRSRPSASGMPGGRRRARRGSGCGCWTWRQDDLACRRMRPPDQRGQRAIREPRRTAPTMVEAEHRRHALALRARRPRRLAPRRALNDALAPMRATVARTALAEVVAQFQAEAERLALAAVRAVIEQELARRAAGAEPSRPRKGRPKKARQRQLTLALAAAPKRQLEMSFVQPEAAGVAVRAGSPAGSGDEREQRNEPEAATDSGPATSQQQLGLLTGRRGRVQWTRDNIVTELAAWLLGGTAFDAAFMTRHGPKGLVAAARRVFGRFDAALNVAALHNAKLYPEGPPTRAANGVLHPAAARRPERRLDGEGDG
jgi:hypothetical protein